MENINKDNLFYAYIYGLISFQEYIEMYRKDGVIK